MLWLDGSPLPDHSAPFDLRDRGLLLGDGVFDTSLALNGSVVFAERHVARLARSCAALGIPMPAERIADLLGMAAAEIGTGSLRLTVTRGAGPRGLKPPADPHPCALLSAQPGPPVAAWRPVTAVTSAIRRNETSPTARHKCLGYLDAVMALAVAAETGAEEALFLNTMGRLASAAVGNLFLLRGDTLMTPALSEGVLDGVVRGELLALAPELGLTPVEGSLAPEALAEADAVFMTNSLRLIAPVTALDGAPLATRGVGRVAQLAAALDARLEASHGPRPWPEAAWTAWPGIA